MANKYRVTEYEEEDFVEELDLIIAESRFNPIYSSYFDTYYEEVSGKKSENKSVMVSKGDTPILCLLRSIPTEDSLTVELEYFGRPAALISNPNVHTEYLSEAIQLLLSFISNDYANPIGGKASEMSGALRISDSRIINTRHFQKLIPTFNHSELKFTRVLNLEQDPEALIADYSKSVRSAVRFIPNELEKIEIIHQNSPKEAIAIAYESLKDLHLKSAGRKTRSEESWGIQRLALVNGHAFISQFWRQGEIVSSAYFMRTKRDSYYGVSASIPKEKGDSLSHVCIHYAIRYCKENNLRSFHFGDQFSHLSRDISNKEKNIEKFKSFFGGEIVLEILFSK